MTSTATSLEGDGPTEAVEPLSVPEVARLSRQVLDRVGTLPGVRRAAAVSLPVHGVARGDEGGHVGDGVGDDEAVAGTGDVQGLVEVTGTGRVDGEEVEVGPVQLGQPGCDCIQRPPRGVLA